VLTAEEEAYIFELVNLLSVWGFPFYKGRPLLLCQILLRQKERCHLLQEQPTDTKICHYLSGPAYGFYYAVCQHHQEEQSRPVKGGGTEIV
jgi:hypothetical protein